MGFHNSGAVLLGTSVDKSPCVVTSRAAELDASPLNPSITDCDNKTFAAECTPIEDMTTIRPSYSSDSKKDYTPGHTCSGVSVDRSDYSSPCPSGRASSCPFADTPPPFAGTPHPDSDDTSVRASRIEPSAAVVWTSSPISNHSSDNPSRATDVKHLRACTVTVLRCAARDKNRIGVKVPSYLKMDFESPPASLSAVPAASTHSSSSEEGSPSASHAPSIGFSNVKKGRSSSA